MFYGEKDWNILFHCHRRPWFLLLGAHRSQKVVGRPMMLLQAIYAGLLLTFGFSISFFWVHSAGFMPIKKAQNNFFSEILPSLTQFDLPSGVPNQANDYKSFIKSIPNRFMWSKFKEKGSRPIFRPKRQIYSYSIVLRCLNNGKPKTQTSNICESPNN